MEKGLEDKTYELIRGKYQNDNDEVIEYRKKTVLAKNPKEISYIEIMDMAECKSPVLASIFPYLIKNADKISFECYEPAIMHNYAKDYYIEITDCLSVLKQKCSFLIDADIFYDEKIRKWINREYKYSLERTIVDMFATAFEELAKIEPDRFIDICFNENSNCPVVIEVLSRCLLLLDDAYANKIIKLMSYNDGYYLFSKSGNQEDFLYYSKQIIRKYSSLCSDEEFRILEKYICRQKKYINTRTMLHRIEHNREAVESNYKKPIVYWSFWGLFQRELLPCLDEKRTSDETKDLIKMFERNIYYGHNRFDCGYRSMDVENPKPFGDRCETFSDNTWLNIIGVDDNKYKDRINNNLFLMNDSRHEYFCSSFSECLNNQPMRFAELSLKFPEDCYFGYISAVLRMVASKKEEISNELASKIVDKYLNRNELSVRMAIMDVIKDRSNICWNKQVLGFLERELLSDEGTVKSENDLLLRLINSAQGYASFAVNALLNSECKLGDYFKSSIGNLLSNNNRTSDMAAYLCVLPYYKFDKDYYYETIHKILKDPNILLMNESEKVLYNLYHENKDACYKFLSEAIKHENEEIASKAAYISTCIYIQLKDSKFKFTGKESLEAVKTLLKKGICIKECSALIGDMLDSGNYNESEFERILYIDNIFDNCVDTVKKVVLANKKTECSDIFLRMLAKKDGTIISKYFDILKWLCLNDNVYIGYQGRRILDNLIICLSKLSEECQNGTDGNMINEMWNQLYIRTSVCNDNLEKIYDSVKYDN